MPAGACHILEQPTRDAEAVALSLPVAPIEPADFRRAALEIPVAAEQPETRPVGARNDDVGGDPVFAVADDDVALVLAAHRRDGAVDDLLDLDDAGVALQFVADRDLAHAEERSREDFQQAGRAAGA